MRDKIDNLDSRLKALELLCAQTNTNIVSLQTIGTLQNNDYVTSVSPLIEAGATVGYRITFTKSSPIDVYHGKKGDKGDVGEAGKTPIIGVSKDIDGIYYWTIDGEWILSGGNKIKAVGTNGQNGADAITPKLKIENGRWLLSTDGGITWTDTGQATGGGGDSMFDDITQSNTSGTFTLADGSSFVLPKQSALGLTFINPLSFVPQEVKNMPYTIVGATTARITIIGALQGWKIVTDSDNSKFVITAPTTISDNGHVELGILISDGVNPSQIYPLALIVNPIDDGVVIAGTLWATKNVEDCYTFAPNQGSFGKFYQYNRKLAIAPTGIFPSYTPDTEYIYWEPKNDPCPDGWRLPTTSELKALLNSGFRKADPSPDNWNVYGIWFGPDAQTATSTITGNAIFLPAAGSKYDNYDPTTYFLKTIDYWSSSLYNYDKQYAMAMWNADT